MNSVFQGRVKKYKLRLHGIGILKCNIYNIHAKIYIVLLIIHKEIG